MRYRPLLLIVSLFGASLSASAVDLIDDQRRVETFSSKGSNDAFPSSPFAPFSVSGQNTTVSSTAFGGSGSGFGESDFDFFIQESTFDVTFAATEPTLIDLSGSLSGNGGDFGLARLRVRLFAGSAIDDTMLIYSDSLSADIFKDLFMDFDFADRLAVGTYRLVLQADITPGGFSTYGDFSFSATFTPDPNLDSDGDGVFDETDNCIVVANPDQTDADGDGYGNRCDADLNNDCVVNVEDLGLLRAAFFSSDALADLNVDGVVNIVDLGLMRSLFFGTPGPAGLGGICES